MSAGRGAKKFSAGLMYGPPALKKLSDADFELLERFAFYRRAGEAYAVVVTGELDGNVILEKGPVAGS